MKTSPEENPSPAMNPPARKREQILLVLASLYLCGTCVRRLLPISEMPSPALNTLSLIVECALTFAVVALGFRVLKALPAQNGGRGGWVAIMLAGVLGALGVFGIRLSGGPRVEWPPRPTQSESNAAALPPDLAQLLARADAVMSAYSAAEIAAVNSRWGKTDPSAYRTLPRSALTEQLALQRTLVDATDRIIALLEEPATAPNMLRLVSETKARGQIPQFDFKPDGWRLLRRIFAGSYRILVLVDANWDEWRATPAIPENGKPWQKEILALVQEVETTSKAHEALVESKD